MKALDPSMGSTVMLSGICQFFVPILPIKMFSFTKHTCC